MRENIKMLIMDVDGTLTDGKIYMGNDGEVLKAFNAKDGYGIHNMLIPNNITPVIITGRVSDIVANRCKELEITELYQGISDKEKCMEDVVEKYSLSCANVAYIGDDNNDLSCINRVKKDGGYTGCPMDASGEVRKISDYVCKLGGGQGAVREFIETILGV
ncbi:MAG: 3-deoxy-D-manno-octulosonate 8-phosphate phosphatase [Lachnospiraceae bacterium]|nr:3-deoxy-D-manno-octulosonate 8-phosphate phosphatase [Lachnospiraceae bacterium]